jgi:multicomponent Na+:H+ antiporter subunit E
MTSLPRAGLLVVLWLLAWGEVSPANLLSGAAVAAAVLVAFPPEPRSAGTLRVRPLGVARLVAFVTTQLVVSNVVMAREILRRHPRTEPGVLVHHLRSPSDVTVTVMTTIIALSPGTMTVDVDEASTTIAVHFFQLDDVDASRAALDRLERLVTGAVTLTRADPVPTPEATE